MEGCPIIADELSVLKGRAMRFKTPA